MVGKCGIFRLISFLLLPNKMKKFFILYTIQIWDLVYLDFIDILKIEWHR